MSLGVGLRVERVCVSHLSFIIGANYVVRRRRYCDEFVMMCVCVRVRVCVSVCVGGVGVRTPDRNDVAFGTVVVLDTASQPTEFGFKSAKVWVRV